MPLTTDIAASYRRPGAVVRDHPARDRSEARLLAFLMGSCLLFFVSQWPALAREAHLQQTELNPMLGGALMAWIFFAPLLLYGVAALVQLGFRVAGRPISGFASRLALFWALLASSPLILLNGLTEGFIGQGLELTLVGLAWIAVFAWFWIAGLRAVRAAEVAA